jgi:hypothetical protein
LYSVDARRATAGRKERIEAGNNRSQRAVTYPDDFHNRNDFVVEPRHDLYLFFPLPESDFPSTTADSTDPYSAITEIVVEYGEWYVT